MASEERPTKARGTDAGTAVAVSGDTVSGDAATELAGTQPRARREGPQPRTVGRFRIDGQLGSGGMGDVYRAYDPVLDRAVALKVLRAEHGADDAQRRRRIVREARAAAALTHANTVTIFEVGDADDEVFIAMELLDGEDLRATLDRGDASLEQKLRWLCEAARALGAAHERGLVHRDVKPENMFVCKNGTLKLLDFGIAKRDEDEDGGSAAAESVGPSSLQTAVGRRLGTPRYMAPEQHAGDATDSRTDQYAWGLVAFELLTGSLTIDSLETVTGQGDVAAGAAPPASARLTELRARVPELPEAIALTIARALEPRKDERFASMTPIVEALDAKAEPVAPASVPRARRGRIGRWRKAGLVAAVLVTISAAGAGIVHYRRPAARVVPPACRLDSTRSVEVKGDDRIALLPTGELVIARDTRKGIRLERESPAGMTPMLKGLPMMEAIGNDYSDLTLFGTMLRRTPAVAMLFVQDAGDNPIRGSVVGVFTETGTAAVQRVPGPVTGIALTVFGDGPVVVATHAEGAHVASLPWGVHAYRLGVGGGRGEIEKTIGDSPAVAATEDRLAVAYHSPQGMRFVLLDKDLQRVGDMLTVSGATGSPAVAFDGSVATVFWTTGREGKTRLMVSTFTPGQSAFTPPRVAIDEALAGKMPITTRLSDGRWAVSWVASSGGVSALRISPIGPGGTLTAPSTVATTADIQGLTAAPRGAGTDFTWVDGKSAVHVAHVECTTP